MISFETAVGVVHEDDGVGGVGGVDNGVGGVVSSGGMSSISYFLYRSNKTFCSSLLIFFALTNKYNLLEKAAISVEEREIDGVDLFIELNHYTQWAVLYWLSQCHNPPRTSVTRQLEQKRTVSTLEGPSLTVL